MAQGLGGQLLETHKPQMGERNMIMETTHKIALLHRSADGEIATLRIDGTDSTTLQLGCWAMIAKAEVGSTLTILTCGAREYKRAKPSDWFRWYAVARQFVDFPIPELVERGEIFT